MTIGMTRIAVATTTTAGGGAGNRASFRRAFWGANRRSLRWPVPPFM
jgi:hypothetical protein